MELLHSCSAIDREQSLGLTRSPNGPKNSGRSAEGLVLGGSGKPSAYFVSEVTTASYPRKEACGLAQEVGLYANFSSSLHSPSPNPLSDAPHPTNFFFRIIKKEEYLVWRYLILVTRSLEI
jgi:hypothetical protein